MESEKCNWKFSFGKINFIIIVRMNIYSKRKCGLLNTLFNIKKMLILAIEYSNGMFDKLSLLYSLVPSFSYVQGGSKTYQPHTGNCTGQVKLLRVIKLCLRYVLRIDR